MPMTHRLVLAGQCLIKRDVHHDPSPGYAELKRLVASADNAFTNFEGSIVGAHGGAATKSQYLAAVPPTVLDGLKDAGFDLLSLSNNHAFDYGPGGVLSTVEEADRRGFAHAGAGRDLEEASRPAFRRAGEHTVALIAMDCGPQRDAVYASPGGPASDGRSGHGASGDGASEHGAAGVGAPGINPMRLDGDGPDPVPRAADHARIVSAIRSARERADLVLVYAHSHHWSDPMWDTLPAMRRLSQGWVEAGADIVVGHGTPAFQGIEVYRGKPIFHGLGNFIFHSWRPQRWLDTVGIRPWQGVVATCVWTAERKVSSIELRPIAIGHEHDPGERPPSAFTDVPVPARGEYGERILANLAELSRPLGTTLELDGTKAVITL